MTGTEHAIVKRSNPSSRGRRGGSWLSHRSFMAASFRSAGDPAHGFDSAGFRVASIPEPSTLLLGAMATVGLLMRRRRLS